MKTLFKYEHLIFDPAEISHIIEWDDNISITIYFKNQHTFTLRNKQIVLAALIKLGFIQIQEFVHES